MCAPNDQKCRICLENVNYAIQNKEILTNITATIEHSGITGIIGPSGSGKSTFLRLLNRLISPTTGKLLLDDQDYDVIPTRQLRKQIGLVQQRPFLFPGTVRENLQYGPNVWGIEYSEEELSVILAKAALPSEFLDRNVEGLSGGEQQRVSLARSLANQPQVLLLDEPTSGLDVVSEEIFEQTIEDLSQEGIKIIIVTHSLEQTKRLTDQLLFLRNGKLIEIISTQSFFQKYSEAEVRGLFKAKEEITQ
ncbi:MAG: ATP-binding cassette domain-containing protein [Candidatus Thorarchaeota archaeon]